MQPHSALDVFHAAFTASEALTKKARRLADLEFRFTMRFRLWEAPPDNSPWEPPPPWVAQVDRLGNRRRVAISAAEDAAERLQTLWDDISCRLPPFGAAYGHAYGQLSVAVHA
jgi:hypothetical protein